MLCKSSGGTRTVLNTTWGQPVSVRLLREHAQRDSTPPPGAVSCGRFGQADWDRSGATAAVHAQSNTIKLMADFGNHELLWARPTGQGGAENLGQRADMLSRRARQLSDFRVSGPATWSYPSSNWINVHEALPLDHVAQPVEILLTLDQVGSFSCCRASAGCSDRAQSRNR